MEQQRDPYGVLGVKRQATPDEIRSAYRVLARRFHPDQNPGDPRAAEKFYQATQAYDLLSDPQKRKQYDLFGFLPDQSSSPLRFVGRVGWKDVKDAFFQIWSQSKQEAKPRTKSSQGQRVSVQLTFEEARSGVWKEVALHSDAPCLDCKGQRSPRGRDGFRLCLLCQGMGVGQPGNKKCIACQGQGLVLLDPCALCQGTGKKQQDNPIRVRFPAGVHSGDTIPIVNKGEAVQDAIHPTAEAQVVLQNHPLFEREGSTLVCTVPVPWLMAMTGGIVEVPTLESHNLELKIPPGTQSGAILRVKGKGFPVALDAKEHGDAHYHIVLEWPKNITLEQEKVLRQLMQSFAPEQHPRNHAFVEVVCRRRGSNPHAPKDGGF